jgi:hypothetical protein
LISGEQKIAKQAQVRRTRSREDFVKEILSKGWVFSDNKPYISQNISYTARCIKHPTVVVEAIGRTFLKTSLQCSVCASESEGVAYEIPAKKAIKERKQRSHVDFVQDLTNHGWTLSPS